MCVLKKDKAIPGTPTPLGVPGCVCVYGTPLGEPECVCVCVCVCVIKDKHRVQW